MDFKDISCNGEFFLGSVTSGGFLTHFDKEITNEGYFTYILKGGAGTGKSSLMKRVATEFADKDEVDVFYCSSDPDSLDAVVLRRAGIILVDGTSPHVFDPIYAGVTQKIVNLGDFWNSESLSENANEIIRVTNENLRLHSRAKRFITAISQLFGDILTAGSDELNTDKLDGFTKRIVKRIIPKSKAQTGKITFSQLSALTPKGYLTQLKTIDDYQSVYLLNDELFAGADYFLKDVSQLAVARGFDVVVSCCNIVSPNCYEHLLIPELKTAFIATNSLTNISPDDFKNAKVINFPRFYDKDAVSAKKQRVQFNRRVALDLTAEAVKTLKNAKAVHDDIEKFYISAMDFCKVNEVCDKIVEEISRLSAT